MNLRQYVREDGCARGSRTPNVDLSEEMDDSPDEEAARELPGDCDVHVAR